jgi:hypothetical protein
VRTRIQWQAKHFGLAFRRSATYRIRAGLATALLASGAAVVLTAPAPAVPTSYAAAAILVCSAAALLQRPALFTLMAGSGTDGYVTVQFTNAYIVKTHKPGSTSSVVMRGHGTGTAVSAAGAESFPVGRTRFTFDVDTSGSPASGGIAYRLWRWQDHAMPLSATLTLASPEGAPRVLAVELKDNRGGPLRLTAPATAPALPTI